MESAPSKASDRQGRNSWRPSRRASNLTSGGEADDLEIGANALVADGFSPQRAGRRSNSLARINNVSHFSVTTAGHSDTSSHPSIPPASPPSLSHFSVTTAGGEQSSSSSDPPTSASRRTRMSFSSRPSSIAKVPALPDQFALRRDGSPTGGNERSRARSASLSQIRLSIAAPHPYDGPLNPSHPYELYPQNVRESRPISLALATPSASLQGQPAGRQQPSHPYQAYQQAASNAPSAGTPVAGASIGFSASTDRYRRRLGPDGEEIGDIIGPDGHTEELPPYTRYPDEHYARKIRNAESPPEPQPADTTAAAPAIFVPSVVPGAGGIGLATRNPEFEPEDAESPRSRHSSRTFTSDGSHHEINVAAATVSEKGKPLKKWQVIARRRVCGVVPYWAICLLAVVLLVMIILVGAVVGTIASKHNGSFQHHGPDLDNDSNPTITVTYDAVPLPTAPAGLPPLATGTFSMPFMSSRASSLCFNDTAQSQAWNCNIMMFSGLYMNVTRSTQPGMQYDLAIGCNESMTIENHVYLYGEQPPAISQSPLVLVNDTFELPRGPAWFKMLAYNKTIIIPEAYIPSPTASPTSPSKLVRDYEDGQDQARRNEDDHPFPFPLTITTSARATVTVSSAAGSASPYLRKTTARPGEKPWICVWPETFLEVFIYAEQNSSFANAPANWSTPAANMTSYLSGLPSMTGTAVAEFASYPTGQPLSGLRTPATASTAPSYPGQVLAAGSTPTSSEASPASGTPGPTGYGGWPRPPMPYPRVVKVEERRVAESPQPVCRQVIIQPDNQPPLPALDSNGRPIVLTIAEIEFGPPVPSLSRRHEEDDARQKMKKMQHVQQYDYDDIPNGIEEVSQCGCMWWIT